MKVQKLRPRGLPVLSGGSGYTAGTAAPTTAVNCILRSGHGVAEKTEMLQQLWSMFQNLTGIATGDLALSLQEILSSNAMEMGQISGVGPDKVLAGLTELLY